ncbi:MAG: hypothetical protein ACRDLK_12615, partial [Gaiellaceae bacterium]
MQTEEPQPLSLPSRDEALELAASIIRDAWSEFDSHRPYQPPISDFVRALLSEPLPEQGRSALEALEEARAVLDQSLAQTRRRWFAFVGSSGLPAG